MGSEKVHAARIEYELADERMEKLQVYYDKHENEGVGECPMCFVQTENTKFRKALEEIKTEAGHPASPTSRVNAVRLFAIKRLAEKALKGGE